MAKFQRYRPFKDPVSASNENAKAAALEGLLNASGGNGFFGGSGVHGRQTKPGEPFIWAKITSSEREGTANRWTYAFKEVFKRNAGFEVWTEVEGGIEGIAYNVAENLNISGGPGGGPEEKTPDDAVVQIWRTDPIGDEPPEWQFYWFPGGRRFVVLVTPDGGAGGGPDTDATWTYQVKDKDTGEVLANGKSPKRRRHPRCEYLPASDNSPGIAYRDAGGSLQLYEAVEEIPAAKWITVKLQEWPNDNRTARALVLERKIILGPNDYKCVHTFSCTFDCAENEWLEVIHVSSECAIPPPAVDRNVWIIDYSSDGCTYLYTVVDGSCTGPDDDAACTGIPAFPGEPDSPPEYCCPDEDGLVCLYAWESVYDCDADTWSEPTYQGVDCQVMPEVVNEWVLKKGEDRCSARYATTGVACATKEDPSTCPEPPAGPAAPTERPTACCEPEPEEEACTELVQSWTVECVDGVTTIEPNETISVKNSALCEGS